VTAPTLVPVGEAAAPLLATLHAEAFPASEAWGPDAIVIMLRMPGAFALLAEAEGEPVGFAMVLVAVEAADLLTIAVRPACQRRGHARALLQGACEAAAARGAEELLLEVSEANDPARALYDAMGARQVGRRPRYYTDGTAALVMRIGLGA
jgi:ribosomal-protein-alanine N-acetyltransferase